MANAFYTLGIERFLKGLIAFNSDTIKAALLTSAYTPNLATHEFYSDLSGVVGTPQALASKTTTGGKAYAGNTTFPRSPAAAPSPMSRSTRTPASPPPHR